MHKINKDEAIIYCDVDGTLLIWPNVAGRPGRGADDIVNEEPKINVGLVQRLKAWKKETGGTIIIWTGGGKEHAEYARRLTGLDAVCLSKPKYVVDDGSGLGIFTRAMRFLSPFERFER